MDKRPGYPVPVLPADVIHQKHSANGTKRIVKDIYRHPVHELEYERVTREPVVRARASLPEAGVKLPEPVTIAQTFRVLARL